MRNPLLMFFVLCATIVTTMSAQWRYLPGTSGTVMAIGGYADTVFVSTTAAGFSDSAKVWRSTDYGITWQNISQQFPISQTATVQCFTRQGSNFYAGMIEKGVRRSTDAGHTWSATTSFYALNDAYSLASRGDTLYVGYYNVARSTNFGSTWTAGAFGHPASITMGILPLGNRLFSASSGISLSTDGGVNWAGVNTGIPNTSYTYYIVAMGTTLFANLPGYSLYKSTNFGASWTPTAGGMASDSANVMNIISSPPYLFAGTDVEVYVSRDTGKSWQPTEFSNPVPYGALGVVGPFLYAGSLSRHALLDFYPTASVQKIITTTGSYSFNDASNTTGVTLNITSLTGASMLTVSRYSDPPANPSFVSSPPVNVSQYRWVIDAASGFGGTAEIRISLSAFSTGVVNPADVHIYKRSTSGTGDFIELPTTYDSNTNEIVATVTSFSEFALGSNTDVLDVPARDPLLPVTTALMQNYPNPFNPATQIAFDLSVQSVVRLTVYNVLGQKVATLVDGIQPAGARSVTWDAASLPSGVYYYKLEAIGTTSPGASFTAVRKMMLIR